MAYLQNEASWRVKYSDDVNSKSWCRVNGLEYRTKARNQLDELDYVRGGRDYAGLLANHVSVLENAPTAARY